jgi:hypothetical protein
VRKKRENRKWNVENKVKPKPFVTTSIGTAFTREDKMTAGAMVQRLQMTSGASHEPSTTRQQKLWRESLNARIALGRRTKQEGKSEPLPAKPILRS